MWVFDWRQFSTDSWYLVTQPAWVMTWYRHLCHHLTAHVNHQIIATGYSSMAKTTSNPVISLSRTGLTSNTTFLRFTRGFTTAVPSSVQLFCTVCPCDRKSIIIIDHSTEHLMHSIPLNNKRPKWFGKSCKKWPAQWCGVEPHDRLTDRTTPCASVTIVCILCIRCSLFLKNVPHVVSHNFVKP